MGRASSRSSHSPSTARSRPAQRGLFAPLLLALGTALYGGTTACSSSGGAASVDAIYVVPASLDGLNDAAFYDHPWPSDLRLDPDGSIHMTGMYNPRNNILVSTYIGAMKGLIKGFSPVGVAYFRFTGPIDPSSLPDPKGSLDAGAAVQIIDCDAASPEKGQRHLAQVKWRKDEGVYYLADTLAVSPAVGYPLRPRTKYAVVVTKRVKSEGGGDVHPSADLKGVLGLGPATAPATQAAGLFGACLKEVDAAGIARADIVHATFFTTGDPTSELFAVADDVRASVPAPTVDPATWKAAETTSTYDVYEGVYGPSPNYQAGKIPYTKLGDGGNFVFDASGKPVVQNTFTLRFTLVIPKASACPMPGTGYPLIVYAHGTGGDYRSVVNEGNSVGGAGAAKCIASMGVDQIFHGTRPGAPPIGDPNAETEIELNFFNVNNPIAAATNGRQSAIDVVQQVRLFTETHLTIPASVARGGTEIAFDASRLLFFGHSQGGVNGPLFMAADGSVRGGVLSGTSAMISVALLEKTKPTPSVAGVVRALLGLSNADEALELDLFHPAISLAQSIVDPTDPINYMPFLIKHPRPGLAPKSIFQTEGVNADGTGDNYAPPHGIEIASVAMGLPRQAPGIHPVAEAAFGDLGDVTVPAGGLSGNLAGGLASGVLAQFVPPPNVDGHFVVFDVPAAHDEAAGFCRNLADDPHGRVPAP